MELHISIVGSFPHAWLRDYNGQEFPTAFALGNTLAEAAVGDYLSRSNRPWRCFSSG